MSSLFLMENIDVDIDSCESELHAISTENDVLKRNVEHLTSQIKKIQIDNNVSTNLQHDNIILKQTLDDVQNKCNELSTRLNIALKQMEDRKIVEKNTCSECKINNISYRKEVDALRAQISQYEDQRIEYKERISNLNMKYQSLQSQLNAIYNSATTFFGEEINSLAFLLTCFEKPIRKYDDNSEYIKTIYKQESKIDKLKQVIEKLEKKVQRQPIISHVDDNKDLIEEYRATIDKLKEKIQQLQIKIRALEMNPNDQNENERITYIQKISSLSTEIKSLKEENSDLTKKLENLEKSNLNESSASLKLQLDLESKDREIKALNDSKHQLMEENFGLSKYKKRNEKKKLKNNKIISKMAVEISELQKKIQSGTKSNLDLQKEIDIMKNDAKDHINERDSAIEKLKHIEIENQNLKEINQKMKEKCENLYQENEATKKELDEKRMQMNLIPYSTWSCNEFPNEIIDEIIRISSNDSVQITQKINLVLFAIARKYNAIVNTKTEAVKKLEKTLEERKAKEENMCTFFTRKFPTIKFDFQTFFDNDSIKEALTEEIKRNIEDAQIIRNDFEIVNAHLAKICEFLDAENANDVISRISKILQKISDYKIKIQNQALEIHELNRNIITLRQNSKKLTKKYDKIISKLTKQNDSLQAELEEIQEAFYKHKNETTQQIKNLTEIKDSNEMKINDLTNENTTLIDENKSLQSQIESMSSKIRSLRKNIYNVNDEINRIKNETKEIIKEKEDEMETIKNQLLSQMKALTDESSKSINDLKNENSTLKDKLQECNDNLTSSSFKIKHLETKYDAAVQEYTRSTKTLENHYNLKIKTLEASYNTKLREIEQKRNSMISAASSALAPFLIPGEILDESNFESALFRVRSKLQTTTSSQNITLQL